MQQIDLTQILVAVITVLGGIVIRYLVPLLKEKTTREQRELINSLIDIGVYAADQTMRTQTGAEKKQYVLDLLKGAGYDVESDEVDASIEAAVKNLKIAIKD